MAISVDSKYAVSGTRFPRSRSCQLIRNQVCGVGRKMYRHPINGGTLRIFRPTWSSCARLVSPVVYVGKNNAKPSAYARVMLRTRMFVFCACVRARREKLRILGGPLQRSAVCIRFVCASSGFFRQSCCSLAGFGLDHVQRCCVFSPILRRGTGTVKSTDYSSTC